ncbi:NUDIX hydrolase [Cyanobacterium aponinum AL20118]|uniref:NUDIX hydrolase n=3 Tax=Cyanobacterium aponinum TaxID=379064 RepID=K9Z9J0_CYAAP|nr:NUDIX hydrolase [Cyanobacterium aponinum]MBD2394360.1 NUDIX hydrolase [Cyanobacterium aponinum FACHB-4101]MTF40692.1 NUDIX domain-containing protein [Cyanobacterium aponinum 0216]AFZ55392.1 NUDIX hydrolase [Cyanobacterium aponinum PCC 10605]PHV62825.1 NUDIX hydrolase [Cyanobacterium aponinum IPPAS B-1201]WPF88561.1 NUDIX hydrolase [Cyanobacterium aponinum AL20115]
MWRNWQFISGVLKIIFRHPVMGVTLVPVLPDGRVVLVYRRDCQQWSLPGGMIDWGENVPNTARRELKEETGLDLVNISRLVGVYSSPDRDPRLHSICVLIEVEATGELSVKDTWEISEVKAFPPQEIPIGNLAHDHDRQIQDYLEGKNTIS